MIDPLVVGIGSPHGDDRVGWVAAEMICRQAGRACATAVRTPLDLLPLLEPHRPLIVIDAVRGDRQRGELVRMDWLPDRPAALAGWTSCASTHGWGLAETLELARQLKRTPGKVVLWGLEIGSAELAPLDETAEFSGDSADFSRAADNHAIATGDEPRFDAAIAESLSVLVHHVLRELDELADA